MNGITKMVVTDRARASRPRRLKVGVTGRNGSYSIAADDRLAQAIVVLGGVAVAAAGMCGESAYVASDCVLGSKGDRRTCKR